MHTSALPDPTTWRSTALRSLLFAAAFTLLSVITQVSTQKRITPELLLPLFLGGLLIGLFFAWILPQAPVKRSDLFVLVSGTLFVVQSLNNMIEAYFFTTTISTPEIFVWGVVTKLVLALGEAGVAVLLFGSPDGRPLLPIMQEVRERRSTLAWTWRVIAASTLYLPVYLFFGALISPLVIPYYTDPALALKIPSFSLIIPLEVIRGFLYVSVLMPWVAVLRHSRKGTILVLTLILYLPGAFVPLLTVSGLPAPIIPFHLAEILGDSIGFAALITLLLGDPDQKVAQVNGSGQ